jgi:hypothetical protein
MQRVKNEDYSSYSELQDSGIDPFERQSDADFDYPTPQDSVSNINDASPSQYRKSMAEQSADESSDEQAEMDEQEVSESEAHDRMVQAQTSGVGGALAKFLDASRQFTATLENMRKQALMQYRGCNPRKSLAFDDHQPPSRGLPQQFTPPLKARDMTAASLYSCEFEADSMTSQSSRTARTRLQDNFVVVGTKLLAEHTPDQIHKWLVMHVQQELAIAGGVDDRHSEETYLGGFEQTNVGLDLNHCIFFFLINCCPPGLPFAQQQALQFHAQEFSLPI